MRVAALFSGGKDSTYAIYIALQQGWEVSHLVTIFSMNRDSYMFHTQNIHLTSLLSEVLEIPLIKVETEGRKEEELEDLKRGLKGLKIDGVVTGAIASDYQWSRVNRICHELELRTFSPLWRKEQRMLLEDVVHAGFHFAIVKVSAAGLGMEMLGKVIDDCTLPNLYQLAERFGINVSGEGGEFETLVLDCPLFTKKVVIDKSERVWEGNCGCLNIKRAHLKMKN